MGDWFERAHGRVVRVATVLVALLAWSAAAHAAKVEITAAPILGEDAPAPPGWFAYTVRIQARGGGIARGKIELTDEQGGASRAAYAVRSGEQALVELYAHDVFSKGLTFNAYDENDDVVQTVRPNSPKSEGPLLFDAGGQNRLVVALRDEKIATHTRPHAWAPPEGLLLSLSRAATDAHSGELILPERAAGYGAATVVLIRSDVFVGLPERAARALTDWVISGGSLALVVARTEDLAHPRVAALVGRGVLTRASPAAGKFIDFDVLDAPDPSANEPKYVQLRVTPVDTVSQGLVGFDGGHVTSTRWGAVTDSGLGKVHLLAFDPDADVFVDDPWVRRSMVDLVRAAWDDHVKVALVGSATGFEEHHFDMTRRHLDPNESGRWSVFVAALLLVAYAVAAGPISFRRAAKKNDPIRAILELPLWSLGAVVAIVAVGAVAKGTRSRARRLTLVECGVGTDRCAALRMRALFASSADTLHVEATEPSALPEVVGGSRGMSRALVMERDKARLEDLQGRPWETVLVREDGFDDLGGAVTLVKAGAGYELHNGLSHALVGVIASRPGTDLTFFPRVDAGATVKFDAGRVLVGSGVTPSPPTPGSGYTPRRLEANRFLAPVNDVSKGVGDAWQALEFSAADNIDWWPETMPVVLAEIEGGSGQKQDSGLDIDSDHRLLRVVGETAR
jgi:hypothetical protein